MPPEQKALFIKSNDWNIEYDIPDLFEATKQLLSILSKKLTIDHVKQTIIIEMLEYSGGIVLNSIPYLKDQLSTITWMISKNEIRTKFKNCKLISAISYNHYNDDKNVLLKWILTFEYRS